MNEAKLSSEAKMKEFSFAASLAKGLDSERDFLSHWGETLGLSAAPFMEFDYDMIHKSGQKAELKTESRSMFDTPNVFIERWSNIDAQTPGGPWQSLAKGVSLLYYWFPLNGVVLLFDSLPLLIANIERRDLRMKEIPNAAENGRQAYRGGGYAVKRSSLEYLYTSYLSVEKNKEADHGMEKHRIKV